MLFFFVDVTIPHICHFFYTTAIWGVEILQLKVHKFATKVALQQNSVHYHTSTQIRNFVKIMICMLNCESNYTSCKIARCVKHYTMCNIAHSVKKITLKALSFMYPVENFTLDSKLLHNQRFWWFRQIRGVCMTL